MSDKNAIWQLYDGNLDDLFPSSKNSQNFVARALIDVNGTKIFIPGEFNAEQQKCFIAHNEKIYTFEENFEVLFFNPEFSWATKSTLNVLSKAVIGSQLNAKENFYIGRVQNNSKYHFGAIDPKNKTCSVSIDGRVKNATKYEILVDQNTGNECLKNVCIASRQAEIFKMLNQQSDGENSESSKISCSSVKVSSRGAKPKVTKSTEPVSFKNVKPVKLSRLESPLKLLELTKDEEGIKESSAEKSFMKLIHQGLSVETPKVEQSESKNVDRSSTQFPDFNLSTHDEPLKVDLDQKNKSEEEISATIKIDEPDSEPNIFISFERENLTLNFAPVKSLLDEMQLKTFKSLTLLNVPNNETLEMIKNEEFINKIKSSECREIFINISDKMEFLKSSAWTTISSLYENIESSIIISLNGDDKFQVGWRTERGKKMLNLYIDDAKDEKNHEVENFILDYLRNCLKSGHSGLSRKINPDKDLSCMIVSPLALFDFNGFSLLMIAAINGDSIAVDYFLKNNFDESYKVNDEIAIDFVDKTSKNYSEIVLSLLKANSRFPKDFNENDEGLSEDLKDFIKVMQDMHLSIKQGDQEHVEELLEKHQTLRFFYNCINKNPFSISAYKTAEKSKQFEIMKLFREKAILKSSFEINKTSQKPVDGFCSKVRNIQRQLSSDKSQETELQPLNTGNGSNDGDPPENNSSTFWNRIRNFSQSLGNFFSARHRKERDHRNATTLDVAQSRDAA